MKAILIVILILNYGLLYSQSIEKEKFIELADSLVKIKTDSNFFNQLIRDMVIPEFDYIPIDKITELEKLNKDTDYHDSLIETYYWIEYRIKPQCKCTYHVINENGGMGSASFIIQIDKKYKPKDLPNFELYMNSLMRLDKSEVINKNVAISVSQKYFSKKTRDSHMVMLIFDVRDNSLYWRITRQKGFRKVTEEHVLIDANGKEFMGIMVSEYYRSFWMTLGDMISGVY